MEHPFFEYPVHLYAKSPKLDQQGLVSQWAKGKVYPTAVIAHNAGEAEASKKLGYGKDYVPVEYPKWVNGKIVNNATEEKAAG